MVLTIPDAQKDERSELTKVRPPSCAQRKPTLSFVCWSAGGPLYLSVYFVPVPASSSKGGRDNGERARSQAKSLETRLAVRLAKR